MNLPELKREFPVAMEAKRHHLKGKISTTRSRWWMFYKPTLKNKHLPYPESDLTQNYESLKCIFCYRISHTIKNAAIRHHLAALCPHVPHRIKQDALNEEAELKALALERKEALITNTTRYHFDNIYEAMGLNNEHHQQRPSSSSFNNNIIRNNVFYCSRDNDNNNNNNNNNNNYNSTDNYKESMDLQRINDDFFMGLQTPQRAQNNEEKTSNKEHDVKWIKESLAALDRYALINTVINQTNYNRFESEIEQQIFIIIAQYYHKTGKIPKLPSRQRISGDLMVEHMIMMKRRVDDEIYSDPDIQLMIDETTKTRIPRCIIMVNCSDIKLVLYIKTLCKKRDAVSLYKTTSNIMVQYTANGVILSVLNGDNCNTMLSFRDIYVNASPTTVELGCAMHMVYNVSKKIDSNGGHILGFDECIVMGHKLIDFLFNTKAHLVLREKMHISPNRALGKPLCNNVLQWMKERNVIVWISKHEYVIHEVLFDLDLKVPKELLDFYADPHNIDVGRIYINYQHSFKCAMQILCRKQRYISDALMVYIILNCYFDYGKVIELNDVLCDDIFGKKRCKYKIMEHRLEADTFTLENSKEEASDDEMVELKQDEIETMEISTNAVNESNVLMKQALLLKQYAPVQYYIGDLDIFNGDCSSESGKLMLDDYYVMKDRSSVGFGVDVEDILYIVPGYIHEQLMDDTKTYFLKHWNFCYRSVVAAGFMVDLRFIKYHDIIDESFISDGLNYMRSKLAPKGVNDTLIVDVLGMFAKKIGVFDESGLFGTAHLSDATLFDMNPIKPWQQLMNKQRVNEPLYLFSKLACKTLSFVPDITDVEKFIKQYRNIHSHHRESKGPKSADCEAILRHNINAFHSKYKTWY